MSISAISRRYAKALVSLGAEQGMVEQYSQELAKVTATFTREKLLRLLLESPTCPLEKKAAILADLAKAQKLSTGMKNFLGLLLEKDRLKYLAQIEGDFRSFADELSGIVRARISTAAKLSKAQEEAIKGGLERQTGKKIELTVKEEPSLIGGIRAEIGGKVFDGSATTQLKRIADTLKKG